VIPKAAITHWIGNDIGDSCACYLIPTCLADCCDGCFIGISYPPGPHRAE
jgi:hypothetical protein